MGSEIKMNNFEIIEKPLPNQENTVEKAPEKQFEASIQKVERLENDNLSMQTAAIPAIPAYTPTEQERKIESILEKGLEEEYKKMPYADQLKFKQVGEETSKKIDLLLQEAKINLRKIVNLIKEWLFLIPGVNKYFLEKEAKIKADEIIKLNNN